VGEEITVNYKAATAFRMLEITAEKPCLCGTSPDCKPSSPLHCSMRSCYSRKLADIYYSTRSKPNAWISTCCVDPVHKSVFLHGSWLGRGCGRGLNKALEAARELKFRAAAEGDGIVVPPEISDSALVQLGSGGSGAAVAEAIQAPPSHDGAEDDRASENECEDPPGSLDGAVAGCSFPRFGEDVGDSRASAGTDEDGQVLHAPQTRLHLRPLQARQRLR